MAEGLVRIIIVDNASTDSSIVKIREWIIRSTGCDFIELREGDLQKEVKELVACPEYVLIRAETNHGYAGGNNLGIRFALRLKDAEYILILNNDTTVEPDALAQLTVCADEDKSAAILGSTLVEAGGNVRIAGGAKYNRLLTTIKPVELDALESCASLDYVSGAAMFIRADAIRQVGLLSEDYFLYFEELDFSYRIIDAGLKIAWCPSSVIYHAVGRSAGSRSAKGGAKSKLAEYHSNLSCLIFTWKHYPELFWVAAGLRFLLKLVHFAVHRQPELLIPLTRAYRDGFRRVRRAVP
jgi:GT2 family glycosyltransferase